jgi:gliding motility-associated-like protein
MPYKIFIVFAFLGCQLSIGQTLPQHYFHLPANSGVNNLFFNQSACEKFQFIYSQSEISTMVSPVSGPVTIDTIWFRFGGGSSNTSTTLSNFQIRMGHTTLTNPGPQFNNNFNVGTAQTVLSSASYTLTPLIGAWNTPNNNWTFIVLQTPFSYNFTNNLCIELSFSSSSAAIAGNYADNGGVPISQYAGNSTATSASATSSRPMFGISSGQACPNVTATSSQINVTCSGGSDGSATVVASGGTSFTYAWSPSGGSNATANGLTAGNYTCTITNNCGNSTIQNFTLTETIIYQLNAIVIQPTCGNNNGCISFAPTPAGTYFYTWPFPSNWTVDSVCDLSPGSYDITINSADGCPIDTTIIIAESFSFNVVETITPANCVAADGAISVSAVGGTAPFTYSWSTGGSSGNTLTNLTAGIYSVTITDQNGCIVTESYTVPQVNTFSFDVLPSSATISFGESIQLTANSATSYSWSPSSSLSCNDCSAPIANPTSTTTYTVTGTDENGCTSTAQATISLAIDCDEVFVPTIFSPNGSGPEINDLLCVMGNCISQLRYSIYNRWGDLVFSTEDISICWDGTYKGKSCQTGVYAYSLVVTKTNGETIVQSGNLTLIK